MQTLEYFLCSERLGFRWWTEEDFPLAKLLWGDPEVTRLFSRKPLSDIDVQKRLNTEIDCATTHGMQYWPMFELASDELVGCCGLRPYRGSEKIYELGFHLRPPYWGKGFATEAARAVVAYGMDRLAASAIFAGHHPANMESRKVLLKLGFEETGTEFYEPTGLYHPSYIFRGAPP